MNHEEYTKYLINTRLLDQFPHLHNPHMDGDESFFHVYLDSAATTQKPRVVINRIIQYYYKENANPHRGVHWIGDLASNVYENARIEVAKFINADSMNVIFTKNTTEGINLVARNFKRPVVISTNHNSNILPWKNAKIVKIDKQNQLDTNQINEITKNNDIICLSLICNVFGHKIQNIKEVIATAHNNGCKVLLDAAQAIAHMDIDVKDLNIDFLAFSGHKLYGPMGIGVLYMNGFENFEPLLYGGGSIVEVNGSGSVFAESPYKFEAGTPNVAGAVGLSAAIIWFNAYKNYEYEQYVIDGFLSELQKLPFIRINGSGQSIINFSIPGIHSDDIAQVLSQYRISVRSGRHCAHIYHDQLQLPDSVRISIGLYNTLDDFEQVRIGLNHCKELFL